MNIYKKNLSYTYRVYIIIIFLRLYFCTDKVIEEKEVKYDYKISMATKQHKYYVQENNVLYL